MVTFKNHTLLTKQDKEWLKDFKMDFTENEALALSFIRKNEVMTNSDYQKLCNLNRDRSLIEINGLIKAQGVGRGTVYMFSDKIMVKDEVYTPQDNNSPPKIPPQDDDLKVKKILAYCTKPRSKKELLSFLQLNDKKSFEKVYLNPLLSTRKLRMTIPNKPTSKNQKYETVR